MFTGTVPVLCAVVAVKMNRVKVDDLKLRPDVFAMRLERRARLREAIESTMPEIDKAVSQYQLDEYYDKALNLIVSLLGAPAFAAGPKPVEPSELLA